MNDLKLWYAIATATAIAVTALFIAIKPATPVDCIAITFNNGNLVCITKTYEVKVLR